MTDTARTAAGTAQVPHERIGRILAWVRGHRQLVTYGTAALVIAAGLMLWNVLSTRRSEEAAGEQLQRARAAFESGNYPLAASEFARIRENYGGTRAAAEATLLLGQTRMLQDQPQQAIDILGDFARSARATYQRQALGLLGAAYEEAGQMALAARAYEDAAAAGRFPSGQAQHLADAGRAWTAAGDTAKAIAAYQRVLRDFGSTVVVTEATVRLGELTRGAVALPTPKQE